MFTPCQQGPAAQCCTLTAKLQAERAATSRAGREAVATATSIAAASRAAHHMAAGAWLRAMVGLQQRGAPRPVSCGWQGRQGGTGRPGTGPATPTRQPEPPPALSPRAIRMHTQGLQAPLRWLQGAGAAGSGPGAMTRQQRGGWHSLGAGALESPTCLNPSAWCVMHRKEAGCPGCAPRAFQGSGYRALS